MCVWSSAGITSPTSSCWQMTASAIHDSWRISSIVARFLGFISSIRWTMWRLSLGSNRKILHGPLMISLRSLGMIGAFEGWTSEERAVGGAAVEGGTVEGWAVLAVSDVFSLWW